MPANVAKNTVAATTVNLRWRRRVVTTVAPSVECNLSVDVGDRQKYGIEPFPSAWENTAI